MCCVLPRHTRSNPYPNAETHARCGVLPPAKARKAREILFFSPLTPPPVPVVVETINPTASHPCRVVITDPATWTRCKGVDIKESHAELWTVRSPQQHSANLVVFPSRLPQPSISSRAVCHLLFGRLLASSVCVCSIFPPKQTTPPPSHFFCVPSPYPLY